MSKAWPLTNLRDVLQAVSRGESVQPTKEYKLLGIRLDGQGPFFREVVSGTETSANKLFRVANGDFIYSRLFACRGAFGVIDSSLDGCFVSNEFPTFVPDPNRIDVNFLKYWFRLPSVIARVDEDCTGSTPLTRNRYKEEFFLRLEIPLPPLAEQRRIVARIEVLINQINEAKALSQESRDGAAALFPSLLSEMLLGSGVIANVTVRKSATALLHESAKRYTASMSKNNNAHPGQPVILSENPKPLPKNWVWTTLGSVLSVLVDCVNDTPDFAQENTGLLGLKSTNIRPYKLDLSRKWFVTPKDFSSWNRRETPRPGDIILTREAPMGLSCKLPEGVQACLTQRLMLLRADDRVAMPDLVLHFLNSSLFLQQVEEQCRGLTTPHIRVQDTPKFVFPLPPLEVQHDLVKKLEQLQGEIDSLKSVQRDVWEEMEATVPAILDRAFKGELA